MENYMESQLTALHNAGVKSRFREKFIGFACGLVVLTLLPYVHLGFFYYIWSPDKPVVDRDKCSCDCFDTVFRGRYEWPPSAYKHVYFNCTSNTFKIWLIVVFGLLVLYECRYEWPPSAYKHVYFNCTSNTFKIWLIVVFGLLVLYECLRYIAPLVQKRKLRASMFVLFLSSLYPHYYGWWGLISYLNEDYYPQWYHQLFFSGTEMLSTAVVVHLCNRDNNIQPWMLLIILNVNVMHIIVGALDQFIDNVLYRRGQHFEAVRDLGLMAPDVFHVLVAYFELSALAEKQRTRILRLFYREEISVSILLLVLFSILGKNL